MDMYMEMESPPSISYSPTSPASPSCSSPPSPSPSTTQQIPNLVVSSPCYTDLQIHISIEFEGRTFWGMIDRSSPVSFIGPNMRRHLDELNFPVSSHPLELVLSNGIRTVYYEHFEVTIQIGGFTLTEEVTYMPDLLEDVCLGWSLLKIAKLEITLEGIPVTDGNIKPDAEATPATKTVSTQTPSNFYGHRLRRNKLIPPKDPFEGITLEDAHTQLQQSFTIKRPWGNIFVLMNKKRTEAKLHFKNMKKTVQIKNNNSS